MDGALYTVVSQGNLWSLAIGFTTGFLLSFNPVAIAAIPVTLAYVTKSHAPRRAAVLGGAFILGMLLTHVVLGVGAALGGEWVRGVMGREWALLLGPLLIVLGLMWPGWLKLRLPGFGLRARPATGVWGAFLLGIPFSIAICPFCTPALVVMLAAAAATASVGFGVGLLAAFALGRAVPILLGAVAVGWLESLKVLSGWQRHFETLGGLVLIGMGGYLLNEYFLLIGY